ncbi:gamma-glutamyltransferase family protein [Bacteroidota bacterium]
MENHFINKAGIKVMIGYLAVFVLYLQLSVIFQSCIQNSPHYCSSENGVVGAGRKGSAEAGIQILNKGGNAADGAAATILALSITDFGAYCIGGEVPLIHYDAKTKKVKVFSGMGTAPHDPEAIQWYYENGIPPGDLKAAAVPAVIDLIVTILQQYGSMSFEDITQPSLTLLDRGSESWHPNLAATFNRLIDAEKNTSGSRNEKLQAVSDRFYRGDIADELFAWYSQMGGLLTREDLAAHHTHIEEPVTINYRGYQIYKCETWTQGPVLCQALQLLEGFDLKSMGHNSDQYIHTVIEALKLAMADRDTYYGDPLFIDVPLKELLSEDYNSVRRKLIDMDSASHIPRPGDPVNMKPLIDGGKYESWPKGTTTCVVADKFGNFVAATPSGWGNNDETGGKTGVTHGTRLISLNTTPGHPNRIEAGKRPRITLTPTMVLKEGHPVMAISVAGGDIQDQTTLQILLNIIEFGMDPFEAVNAPRFANYLHQDSFDPNPVRSRTIADPPNLQINLETDPKTIEMLQSRGHVIDQVKGAIGVPAIALVDEKGMIYAATDTKTGHEVSSSE